MTDTFTGYDPQQLPNTVVAYLDARDDRRYTDAAALFAADATVVDDGTTYDGLAAITRWIEDSSTDYTYSATRLGQQVPDGDHVALRVRLDGNFPGGTVTLGYRFQVAEGRIHHLTIGV